MRLCAFIVHALNSMCISQATANDRAAGNGRLADALRIVDEDKESALAEAASRAATEPHARRLSARLPSPSLPCARRRRTSRRRPRTRCASSPRRCSTVDRGRHTMTKLRDEPERDEAAEDVAIGKAALVEALEKEKGRRRGSRRASSR
jgi:hypothetical protein